MQVIVYYRVAEKTIRLGMGCGILTRVLSESPDA